MRVKDAQMMAYAESVIDKHAADDRPAFFRDVPLSWAIRDKKSQDSGVSPSRKTTASGSIDERRSTTAGRSSGLAGRTRISSLSIIRLSATMAVRSFWLIFPDRLDRRDEALPAEVEEFLIRPGAHRVELPSNHPIGKFLAGKFRCQPFHLQSFFSPTRQGSGPAEHAFGEFGIFSQARVDRAPGKLGPIGIAAEHVSQALSQALRGLIASNAVDRQTHSLSALGIHMSFILEEQILQYPDDDCVEVQLSPISLLAVDAENRIGPGALLRAFWNPPSQPCCDLQHRWVNPFCP